MHTPSTEPSQHALMFSSKHAGSGTVSDEAAPLVSAPSKSTWQLPLYMIALYIMAGLCAVAHLLTFRHLDGRRLGIDTRVEQTWIVPLSFLFALAFRGAILTCLAVVFDQRMWRVMMASIISVKTIDRLYQLQKNFFALFHVGNISASPSLFLLACFYWIIPIAVIFPSGALTVQGNIHTFVSMQHEVPTFDSAYIGNGSLKDAIRFTVNPDNSQTQLFENGLVDVITKYKSKLLSSSAIISLVSENTYSAPSPCGTNCTYGLEFDGPILRCNQTSKNISIESVPSNDDTFKLFTGGWDDAKGVGWNPINHSGTNKFDYKPGTFTLTSTPFIWNVQSNNTANTTFSVLPTTKHTCSPCRANYKIKVNYTLGTPEYKVDTELIDCLDDFWYPGDLHLTDDNFLFNNSQHALDDLRGANLWFLTDSLLGALAGDVTCNQGHSTPATLEHVETPDNQTLGTITGTRRTCLNPQSTNGTTIIESLFNARRFDSFVESPELRINEDLLNSALINVTLSMMNRLQLWSTETDVTSLTWANSYQFNDPLRLITPYFVTLAIALPFLLLGLVSLWKNGAPAPTGRVVDVLILGATSEDIRAVAKDISFEKGHGYGEGTKRVERLMVRYGEFVDSSTGQERKVKRLGTYPDN